MNTSLTKPQPTSAHANQLNPKDWVLLYENYFYHYTLSKVNCSEAAKDLVQDTFLAGLKSAKNYRGEASEKTWLISILKRKIIDHYRKKNSNIEKSKIKINDYSNGGIKVNWLEEFVPDPDSVLRNDIIENEELRFIIQDCISKLPEKQAEAFIMTNIERYHTESVCKILDLKKTNLWVILYRARLNLRYSLKRKGILN